MTSRCVKLTPRRSNGGRFGKDEKPGLGLRHSFTFAYRHVRSGLGRSALSIIAIALGVALVVAFQLMNTAVRQAFLDSIDAMAGRAQLIVSAGEGLSFPEEMVDKVKVVPGVKLAVALVRSTTFPDDGSGEMLTVHGIDITNEAAIRVYHDAEQAGGSADGAIDDMVGFLNSPDSILLGRELAEKRGLAKGDPVRLVTPSGVQTFTIKGLLDAQGLAQTLRGRIVVMDIFAAQRAFTAEGMINQIDVLVEQRDGIDLTADAIGEALGVGFSVQEPALRKHLARRTIAGFQIMMTAFGLLTALAGLIICYSRLSTVFAARTWEVGLLRAVGMDRRAVVIELFKESLLTCAVGAVLGLALGRVLRDYGLPFFAATTAIALRLPVPSTPPVTDVQGYILGVLVGIAAALGATAAPAWRLARTQPIEALRLRDRELAYSRYRTRGLLQLALLLLILAAIIWQQAVDSPAIGHVTTMLVAVTACTFAGPLVAHGGAAIGALWRPFFGPVAPLAGGWLRQHARRSAFAICTIAIGVGLVVMLGILEWSFERTLADLLDRRFRSEIVVSSSDVATGEWGGQLNDELLSLIRVLPGVAAVTGQQRKEVSAVGGKVVVAAYDPSCLREGELCRWSLRDDSLPDAVQLVHDQKAVMVSEAFARQRRVQPGDRLQLKTIDGNLDVLIAAVSDAPLEPSVIMNRDQYRRAWSDPRVIFIYVKLIDAQTVATVEELIRSTLGARYRLMVHAHRDHVELLLGRVREAFRVQYLIAVIVLLIVSAACSDALASGILERTRQLGMLRAVGLPGPAVFRALALECAAIVVLGLTLAVLLGVALGVLWTRVQFPAVVGWRFTFYFPGAYVLAICATTAAVCFLGSLLPARRAARLPVMAALRSE